MVKLVLIAGIGGFFGTIARFLIARYFQLFAVSLFPWGTLTVNIIGSFIIGIVYGLSERGNLMSPEWRLFLTIGFCGGFTTFSSVSNDAFLMLQGKEFLQLATFISLSFFLGLVAVYFGRFIIKMI